MAKMNLAVPTGLAAVMAGFEAQWVSRRQANAGASSVGDYLLANLNLSHAPVGQPWSLSLGIYNLFDRRYRDPAAIEDFLPITRWYMPQLGRSMMLHGVFRF
jgi:iron complex outermembrane receptor protein